MSWKQEQLIDICEVFNDGDWIESKDQSEDGIRLIQTGNVGLGLFKSREAKARYISEETYKRLRCTEIKEGDILVSRLPEPVGRSCILPALDKKSITAVDCTIIRVKKSVINSDFLNYYFQSPEYFRQVAKNVTGATRQRISRSALGKIKIPFPSLDVQQKIVVKLDAIFSEIDRAVLVSEVNIKNIEALFGRHLTEYFKCAKKDFPVVEFSKIIKLEYGKALPDIERNENGLYEAYGANGAKTRTDKFLCDEPSIIVGRKGSAGELTLVHEKFWALDVTYYVTHDKNQTDLNYIYYALKEKNLTSYARGVKPGINRNDVYELEIPLPPINMQRNIVFKFDELSKALRKIDFNFQNKIIQLSRLKKSILKQAFNGDLIKG